MSDDAVCDAMFACQRAMRPLPLPHRKAVLRALAKRRPLTLVKVKKGKLLPGERRSIYRGRIGLDKGNSMAASVLAACRKAVNAMEKTERPRVVRGLTAWLLEDICPTVEHEVDEMEMR